MKIECPLDHYWMPTHPPLITRTSDLELLLPENAREGTRRVRCRDHRVLFLHDPHEVRMQIVVYTMANCVNGCFKLGF